MSWESDFPRLTDRNHRVTSPENADYNCVAWAAGDDQHWWQPGVFWPVPDWPTGDCGLGALERAFLDHGYVDCSLDATPEPAFEKVALYGNTSNYTHIARQLSNGNWTSKLGRGVDIEHNHPDDIAGGVYGEVAQVMKRPAKR